MTDQPTESAPSQAGGPNVSHALADALAARLNGVTPKHVTVKVFVTEQGGLGHKIRSWRWMSWGQGEERGGSQETAVWNLLSTVQSFMTEKTRTAWPGEGALPELARAGGEPPSRREIKEHAIEFHRRLPLPSVAIENGLIRLWYGDKAEPVLDLEPIQAKDLAG